MNRFTFLAAAAAVSALGFLGCDDKREGSTTMPPGAAKGYENAATQHSGPPTTQDVGAAAEEMKEDAKDAADDAKDATKDAAGDAKDAAGDLGAGIKDAADDAGDAVKDAADDATK